MKRKYNDMEKIERYLGNQVDEQEREEVNKRLVDDEEFRKLFDEMETLLEGIKNTGSQSSAEEKIKSLEATIHELEDEIAEEEDKDDEDEIAGEGEEKKPIIIVWYNNPVFRAIAASVVLLVAAVFVFGPFNGVSEKELYAEYYTVYPNRNPNVRGEKSQQKDSRTLAFEAYDSGNYTQAAGMFEAIIPESDDQTLYRFYLGHCYLKMDQGEKAIEQFKIVSEEGKGLVLQAKWYLGLSYLYVEDRESAIGILTEVKEADRDYSRRAGEILEKLE